MFLVVRDVVRKQYQRLFYWIILDINMPVNFFSLSTGEQKGVVVMVVGGEGGRLGGGVPLCPLHALQVSFATTSVASLPVCVCGFFLGGGEGGLGVGGGWWNRKGN